MATSERLAGALEKSPFSSIHAFKQALNDRFPRVKGRSYSAIHGYFRGVEPPLEFLEAAAEVLDVPVQWLRTGEGSMEHQHIEREYLNVGRLFEECTASGH